MTTLAAFLESRAARALDARALPYSEWPALRAASLTRPLLKSRG